jgi:hypothetical protein
MLQKLFLSIFAVMILAAVAFMGTPAVARADESPEGAACGSPDESTLAVVECLGIDPVPDVDPSDTAAVLEAAAAASVEQDALPHQCRYSSEVAFYAATDWVRLAKFLAADRSLCAEFFISVPPVGPPAGDKTGPRPGAAAAIRAFGEHFHPMAEINYTAWRSWIARHAPVSFYDAGVEAGHRLLAAGYETWALNELPSSVRQGQAGERANAAAFIGGLFDGSNGTQGLVFIVGLGQPTTFLDVYRTNLTNWLRDSLFWNAITGKVRFWAQEAYADVRKWAVPGASREARTSHLADYLMHPVALAELLVDDETTAAARAFFADTYTTATNDAWRYSSAFGWTDVPIDLMQSFFSEQVFAVRHFAGANPQGAPGGRFSSVWAPAPQPPVADTALLLARTASALHFAYAQGGSSQEGACGPLGDHVWCNGELEGAAFVESWGAMFPWPGN